MVNEKLYKIYIKSIMNNITLDGAGIFFDDSGMAFVEIHPADAVEVVRCKDCWKSGEGLCSYQLKNVPGKDFCGDGERKDND